MSLSASIIIPAWNGRDYIEACLTSVMAQSPAPLEVIVVDNASTDGTADLIADKFPSVRLIQNVRNRGFSGGCNAGLAIAQGDYFVLLNQDTAVDADWLQILSQTLDNREVGIAGCKIFYPDGKTIQHAGVAIDWPLGLTSHVGHGQPDSQTLNTPASVEAVTGAAMAFRRDVLAAVGPLDEGFWPGYFEDVDFCLRVREAGYDIQLAPDATLTHVETTSITDQTQLSSAYQRGRLRFILKHTPPDRFLSEFVPAEEAYQLPAILGAESRSLRSAYLSVVWAAGSILRQRWQADAQVIDEVISALRQLYLLAWSNDWKKVGAQVGGLPVQSDIAPEQASADLSQLQEFMFTSDVPVIGQLIARFRSLWYSVAAKWAVKHLIDQQAKINYRQAGYIFALERRLMEAVEDNAYLIQTIAGQTDVDDTEL